MYCDVINDISPFPLRSFWFKDGQPIFSDSPVIEESFLVQNPILMPGVFNVPPVQFSHRKMILYTTFTNITDPMLGGLAPDTSLEQARQLLLDIFLGNWTCFVNNSLGSASVEYIIREFGKLYKCLSLLC